jgi:hypothetical protein
VKQKFILEKKDRIGLKIDEYSELEKDQFFLIYQGVYSSSEIESALEKGDQALIKTLRSDNFFPSRNCIDQIAEMVKEIYASNIDNPVELSFDDQDFNFEADETLEVSDEIETLLEEAVVSTDEPALEDQKTIKPDDLQT